MLMLVHHAWPNQRQDIYSQNGSSIVYNDPVLLNLMYIESDGNIFIRYKRINIVCIMYRAYCMIGAIINYALTITNSLTQ